MKDTHRFLAFDCGATSGRAVLASFSNGTFNMEEVYRFPNQTLEIGGKLYWNVYNIYEHFLKCLSDLGHKGIQLDSIGIDTWGVDFGCIAQDGSLLGLPRAYRDPYTDGVPQKVYETIPLEELYEDYVFGKVEDTEIQFDQQRFENIISQSNIYSEPMCADCYAKWNCGGGCRLFHHSFDERYEKIRCNFIRKALKRQLIDMIGSSFKQSTGGDLNAFITNKIENNEI